MSCSCVVCGREVTGEAGEDPRIVVPIDIDDERGETAVYGKCCAEFAPRAPEMRDAQAFLDYTAAQVKQWDAVRAGLR